MAKWMGMAAVGLLLGIAVGTAPANLTPRPDQDDFEKAYALADGEDVKVLRGDAIVARSEHFRMAPGRKSSGNNLIDDGRSVPRVILFGWDGKAPRWKMTMSGIGEGVELRSALSSVLGIKSQEFEGDAGLILAPIRADFLVRDGVPAEKLVPQLDAILRGDFKLPIRLSLRDEERDVIAVGGRYHHKDDPAAAPNPQAAVMDHIEVYAREIASLQTYPRAVTGGDLDGLLSDLGQHFGVRFLDSVKPQDRPKKRLGWKISGFKPTATAPVEDQAPTLDHVAEQTGLTFVQARRKIRILQVDRVE